MMQGLLLGWERCCTSSKVLRFADLILRGIGQVMFQDNPLSGLLFFIAIGWGSYSSGMPQVAIGGVLAVVVATLTAQWLHVDDADLGAGLFGYNAYLVGLALPTFLAPSPLLWLYIALGAAVSVPALARSVARIAR
jgi:urea transporter